MISFSASGYPCLGYRRIHEFPDVAQAQKRRCLHCGSDQWLLPGGEWAWAVGTELTQREIREDMESAGIWE